jgi:DNA-binding SARP family transcriptional activator
MRLTLSLRIGLLGDFRILHGDRPITGVENPRLQSLLAYLLLHRDAPQSRAQLSYLFWLDSTEAQARTNLRKQLHYLRRALPDADRFLYADSKVLHWEPDAPFTLDVADFEAAVDRAEEAERAGDQARLQEALEQAVATYHGDLLPGCYDDWVLPERERLGQAFARAVARLAELHEHQRDYQGAIRYAQRLLRHDPLHEATYRQLMRLHALNGNRAGAVRVYHTCVTVLLRELAVEPGAATQEAYECLLELDTAPTPPIRSLATQTSLVGRDGEWAQLQRAWRGTADGRPRLVMLTGEAGIGKTRLAEALLEWAVRQGIPTAGTRCYASEGGLAYGPVTTWLRSPSIGEALALLDKVWLSEIARLLPDLLVERPEIPPPGPLSEGWQRQRLFQALARPFSERRQLLVLLLILDGWGIGKNDDTNPIFVAPTPVWDKLTRRYPCVRLEAAGDAVGLRPGKPGNSEAGHMNMGAGRVVLQDDVRLDLAMRDGSFYRNEILCRAIDEVKRRDTSLHLIGLLTEKSSHGSIDYPLALLRLAATNGLRQAYLHLIFDGRSTEPGSAPAMLDKLESQVQEIGVGQIASAMGRGIALDRDGDYDKTRRAYDALVFGAGKPCAVH